MKKLEKDDDYRKISLNFPDYGELNVKLFKYSSKIYDILIREKINEIDRLKKLNHLGLLSEIYETTHHSKWEYIFIQLYLFYLFRKGEAYGLSSNVKLKSGKSISKIDLLNSWAFLLSIGHLYRTFQAERIWFNEILSSKKAQSFIIKSLPRDTFKNKFKKMIEDENFMGFYLIISIIFINVKIRKIIKNKEEIEEMLDIFDLWINEDKKSSIKRIKNVFKTIRFIAFMLLDCNYSHSFLNFNTSQLFQYIQKNASQILENEDNELIKSMESINEFLYLYLYCSKKAITYNLNYYKNRYPFIKRGVYKRLSKSELRLGLRKKDRFIGRLIQARKNDFKEKFEMENLEWNHLYRFHLIPEYPFLRDMCKYYSEENKLNKKKIPNVYFSVEPLKYRDNKVSILDIFKSKDVLSNKELIKIVSEVKNYIENCFKNERINFLYSYLFTKNTYTELFEFCLSRFIESKYKIRLDSNGSLFYQRSVVFIPDKSKYKDFFSNIDNEIKKSKLKKDRINELNSTLSFLKSMKLKGSLLIATSPVKLYNEKWNCISEFDGVIFNIISNKLHMILIEAKTGKSTSGKALTELNKKIEKLNLANYKIKGKTKRGGYRYAYSVLSLK